MSSTTETRSDLEDLGRIEEYASLRDPATRGSRSMGERLWRNRELVFTLVKRDLKIRYKSSALGFLWSFGRPLFLTLVIWAVFSQIVREIPSSHPYLPYALHILTGILPWMFLASALSESLYAIVGNGNVVKKVWLPTEVFPASNVLSHLIHLFLALIVLAIFMVAYAVFGRVPGEGGMAGQRLGMLVIPGWEIVLLPFLLLLHTLFIFGIALILASLNVFYRDMASITEIVLSAWFYLTPIIYPALFVRENLKDRDLDALYWLWLSNPMTPITLAYRRIFYGRLFRHGPEVSDRTLLVGLAISVASTVILLWLGARLFRHYSKRFADEL